MAQPKILTLDIESAPNLAYVWGCFKQNIPMDFMVEDFYILSFAAKWLHSDEVIYHENRYGDDLCLLVEANKLLSEADIVVAHNGKKFDIPMLAGRSAVQGLSPPIPFKQVDTCLAARRYFRFPSNSLAYLTRVFGCSGKLKHQKFAGAELWVQCLKQNDEAWKEMRTYNEQDVVCLEELYLRMRPWITNHPNVGVLMEKERSVCPRCGSAHIHYRGYVTTNVAKYRSFQCQDCLSYSRERFTQYDKDLSKSLLTSVV